MKANIKFIIFSAILGFSAGFFASCGAGGGSSSLPSKVSTDAVSTSSS